MTTPSNDSTHHGSADTPHTGDDRSVTLDISGMSCASCVSRVERKLTKLPGVSATVNLPLNNARVQAPEQVTDQQLIDAVASAGYDAEVHHSPHHHTGHDHHAEHDHHDGQDQHSGEDHMNHGPSASTLKPRFIVAAILTVPLFIISMFSFAQFPHWGWVALVLSTPVVFYTAWPFHSAAFAAARHGASTMDTLVSLGVLAAWTYSTIGLVMDPMMTAVPGHHDHQLYFETAGVVTTFLLLGRWLEDRAKHRAGDALRELLTLAPETAVVVREGAEVEIPASHLQIGDEFVVRPGDKIATDGYVVSGHSAVDTSLITGESVPVEVGPDDTVTGATINSSGRLLVRVTRTGEDTTLSRMGQLVSDAQSQKAPIARIADRISAVFVPIVLVIAALTLILWLVFGTGQQAFHAAVTVLIIACPCALGLATPVALLAGTGRASQLGILIRGPEVLEDTRQITSVVFDKTGTITQGSMSVSEATSLDERFSSEEILRLAAAAEAGSEHPIAHAIVDAGQQLGHLPKATEFSATAGGGIFATVEGHRMVLGRTSFVTDQAGIPLSQEAERAFHALEETAATAIWVVIDEAPAGIIAVRDQIKDSADVAIADLTEMELTPMLLTGDNRSVATWVASQVGINTDHVVAGVHPEDKVAKIRELQDAGETVAMVGDGINDAAALAQADLGIAMASGTDVAREAAQITVMGSSLGQITQAIQLSRKTLRVIKSNLFWAFAYNVLALPVAAFGLLSPMIAGAAMALSSVLVVANSLRLTRFAR